jgi:hypothetical protein
MANSSAGAALRAYSDVAVGWSARRAWRRGARGEDHDGGSARAAAAHGPGVRSLPRRAGPTWSRHGGARRRCDSAFWTPKTEDPSN